MLKKFIECVILIVFWFVFCYVINMYFIDLYLKFLFELFGFVCNFVKKL